MNIFSDYFVHRLFQNKDDGKLVEKNSSAEQEAKLEGIQLEVGWHVVECY